MTQPIFIFYFKNKNKMRIIKHIKYLKKNRTQLAKLFIYATAKIVKKKQVNQIENVFVYYF